MLHVPPKVFLAPIDGQAVVLDLLRDKYLALGPDLAQAVQALTGPSAGDVEAAMPPDLIRAGEILVAKGVLARGPALGRVPPSSPPAAGELWPSRPSGLQAARAGLVPRLGTLRALGEVWFALRTLPFHRTIAWVQSVPVRPVPAHRLKSERSLLDEYFAARPWFWEKPICRLDAIALCLHLRRNGHPAKLVFGVRLRPFKAHCWVQCEDRVVNDALDAIVRFTPIMSV